ncbi:Thioesterase/thiol ester dehydrase-isomerase [Gymnopilus junonius]|uniref:Thioesterase/thiol ester dehydrase-isomerase n=1 Tax=Gymnopilus junonius TaxID=109634 RepID=A0A9P5N763_GYMJU|nr:Thioesterase/thiol ester dehydrase-isomerase [Gymnopilus junonius]
MPMRTAGLWSEALLTEKAGHPTTATAEEISQSQATAAPRRMTDSYTELVLPFTSSPQLLEQYLNASGGIRTGKLMEHLDSLAGSIAYKHILGPSVQRLGRIDQIGFYIVTASVDRMDMLSPLDPKRDLRLSGQVIYTGHSSMEVAVKMESTGMGKPDQTVMIGRFCMVCRDAKAQGAREVNPLVLSTPDERALYALGEQMRQRRKTSALKSLSRVPPSSEEAAELHAFMLKHGHGKLEVSDQARDHVWMGDTILEKCMLMFPQERNVHQKIFGGYLMREAHELGFTNASLFTRGHVRFLSLDGISFARPVPIGSILRLRSEILYTTSSAEYPTIVHVGVKANVVDVKTGQEQTTNDFRFTWCQEVGKASPDLRRVVPKTYSEAMLWLEGKRALEVGAEIRGLRTK